MKTDTSILYGLRAAYTTLGCKLNFAETSTLRDRLTALGVRDADDDNGADLCIINTCSVTGEADQKCRQAIRRLHRQHPDAFIAVMGCYAQLQGKEIARIEGVGLVVGTENRGRIIELLTECLRERAEQGDIHAGAAASLGCKSMDNHVVLTPTQDIRTFVPSCSRGNRTRYFLKVQDGCNYYCTYCTIPIARGRSRNGSIASLVAEAEAVAAQGGKEIVITGVNIGDFGRTTGETFIDLIRALDRVEGIARYRISSIEPNLLTPEVIDFCAQSRTFMPHFHIPLQSGSDDVLRLMHRHYDTDLFRARVYNIKEVMPDAFIGVDVIVGTRGERDEYFEDGYRFIQSLPISQLHVFAYSERPGTKALEIPYVVSPQVRHERSQRLLALSEQKRTAFYNQHIGTRRPVLWETDEGWTDNYIRIKHPATADHSLLPPPNTISTVTLGDFDDKNETLLAL